MLTASPRGRAGGELTPRAVALLKEDTYGKHQETT
jgi:hypothetical protein